MCICYRTLELSLLVQIVSSREYLFFSSVVLSSVRGEGLVSFRIWECEIFWIVLQECCMKLADIFIPYLSTGGSGLPYLLITAFFFSYLAILSFTYGCLWLWENKQNQFVWSVFLTSSCILELKSVLSR